MQKKIIYAVVLILCISLFVSPVSAASATVVLDGRQMEFDVPPTIEDGRTLVPLRAIFEGLGAAVEWDGETRTVTATRESDRIQLQIGSRSAYRNGLPVNLDVPAKIIDGRTMVPLRFVSESLGAEVNWNGVTRVITIASQGIVYQPSDTPVVPSQVVTIPWESGVYTGPVENGIPSGQGTWVSEDGVTLEGLFIAGKLEGNDQWQQLQESPVIIPGTSLPDLAKIYAHTSDQMKKAILDKKAENPWLGQNKSEITLIPGGMRLACEAGHIYFGDQVGRAHIVQGSIYNKWMAKEGSDGFLKFPTTDELVTPDQVGRYTHFEGGSIYWHPAIGAFEVHGLIRNKWESLGWEKSRLGYPLSDEMTMEDGIGRYSAFQGGRIYYHPVHGTHFVTGNIYLRWMGTKKNNQVGELGYPTSDPGTSSGPLFSGIQQDFEKGKITKLNLENPGMDLRGEIARRNIEVRNQGNRDTCSVQTMIFLLEYGYTSKFGGKYSHLSVEYLNHAANKAVNRDDDGDFFSSIAKGYETYGIVKEDQWPYDRSWTYSYSEAEKLMTSQMQTAGKQMISSGWILMGNFVKPFERDSTLSNQEFSAILKLLDEGIPVGLGRAHSMVVVGYQYDTGYDGGGYFIFRDSYGTGVGESGYRKESFEKVRSKTNDVYVYR
jgi:hypothetical protein